MARNEKRPFVFMTESAKAFFEVYPYTPLCVAGVDVGFTNDLTVVARGGVDEDGRWVPSELLYDWSSFAVPTRPGTADGAPSLPIWRHNDPGAG